MITGITFWLIVIMANLVVGACVGLTGVQDFFCLSYIRLFWDLVLQKGWL